jgi:antitoxin ParD1/3/4
LLLKPKALKGACPLSQQIALAYGVEMVQNSFKITPKRRLVMPRQSISLTEPNAEWVKAQIDSKEYTSVNDALNDLIRQARRRENEQIEKIRTLLIEAEKSIEERGHSTLSVEERLAEFKKKAGALGLL